MTSCARSRSGLLLEANKSMLKRVICSAAIVLAWPAVAFADSDGYYCVGKGFVAYEMDASQAPSTHLLHIVHVGRTSGITRMSPIPLDDFQVHGMTCRDQGVDLQGWSARYSVDLSNPTKPVVTSTPVPLDQTAPPPQLNLGPLARSAVFDIPSDGAPGEFQLVIAETIVKTKTGIAIYTVTQIFQRDFKVPLPRQVVASETIYRGIRTQGGY